MNLGRDDRLHEGKGGRGEGWGEGGEERYNVMCIPKYKHAYPMYKV